MEKDVIPRSAPTTSLDSNSPANIILMYRKKHIFTSKPKIHNVYFPSL